MPVRIRIADLPADFTAADLNHDAAADLVVLGRGQLQLLLSDS